MGRTRASAEKALRRAVRRRLASSSVAAVRTSMAPRAAAIFAIAAASSATTCGWPSVSMMRTAAASVGRPTWAKSSTQRMVCWSRNSSVQGMIFAAMMSETVSPAASIEVYVASIVFRAAGWGTSFSSTRVTMPSVPSEPMNRSRRLYPATSLTHLLPSQTISPLARTASSPMT